jgi:hypothetical protein
MVLYKLAATVSVIYPDTYGAMSIAAGILIIMISVNVSLAVFNLIPIPPLDGSRVASVILPEKLTEVGAYAFAAELGGHENADNLIQVVVVKAGAAEIAREIHTQTHLICNHLHFLVTVCHGNRHTVPGVEDFCVGRLHTGRNTHCYDLSDIHILAGIDFNGNLVEFAGCVFSNYIVMGNICLNTAAGGDKSSLKHC